MSVVSNFFDAYEARRIRTWGSELDLLGPTERALYESQRLRDPAMTAAQVASVLDRCGFGESGTAAFGEFLSSRSYGSLDCDGWVEFPSTTSVETWERDTTRMRSMLDATRLFAFAYDPGTGAIFCLDRGPRRAQSPVVSIVDQGRILERAFSDFEAVLKVLTRVLGSEVTLFVERGAEPDDDQRRLLAELVDIDPTGFGAVGWPQWYRRARGGTQWGP